MFEFKDLAGSVVGPETGASILVWISMCCRNVNNLAAEDPFLNGVR